MSLWNPDNIKDVAESVGITQLDKETLDNLGRDVDFRVSQVLEEAIKFMRHSRRTTLHTEDVAQALKVLDVEPLFGYDSTRPLRFGEASIGPGQPLYYVEDEEVEFEKLINAPLPKVPREMSFTAHWLAVEGVQPSIPQNPTSADSRHQELLPKGPGANPSLGALSGSDNVAVKPPVKHILSSELQLYFERITHAILDESSPEYRAAALNSLRSDPGLHQLVPYFVHFVSEKVTHKLKDLFVLNQMLQLLGALLGNQSLYLSPYVASFVPPILTCLIGVHPGLPSDSPVAIQALREQAAILIIDIAKKYGNSSQTLKTRLARTMLKTFLDPHKSFGSHYGAILALQGITRAEGIRQLILPNLKGPYDSLLKEGLADESTRTDAEKVAETLLYAIKMCAKNEPSVHNGVNGDLMDFGSNVDARLIEKIGEVMGKRVFDSSDNTLIKTVLDEKLM
jgi:transcription initiation factor TFIID subunit 6